jgi:hypothetical protein
MSLDRFMDKLLPIVKMRGWFTKFNKDRAELTFNIHNLHRFNEVDLDYAIETLKDAENIDDKVLHALMIDGKNKRQGDAEKGEWQGFYRALAEERKVMNVCTGHRQCDSCERTYCTLVAKQAQVPLGILKHSKTMNGRDRARYQEEFSFKEHMRKMAEEFPGLGFDKR